MKKETTDEKELSKVFDEEDTREEQDERLKRTIFNVVMGIAWFILGFCCCYWMSAKGLF